MEEINLPNGANLNIWIRKEVESLGGQIGKVNIISRCSVGNS
jgi:hypothetical protein